MLEHWELYSFFPLKKNREINQKKMGGERENASNRLTIGQVGGGRFKVAMNE